jgi:ribosomal protein L11 methyltransferase
VRVARENARRNGVAHRVSTVWSPGYRSRRVCAGRPYDLVLANILARPLALMARDLRRALAPGGVAVLAGLVDWQQTYVVAMHRVQRLSLVRCIAVDGWRTLILRRLDLSEPQEEGDQHT